MRVRTSESNERHAQRRSLRARTLGRHVPQRSREPARRRARDRRAADRPGAPWHFWLVVVMATVYLGWRAGEGIVWLIQWFAGVIG